MGNYTDRGFQAAKARKQPQSQPQQQSDKSKNLSHVPCKFYRQGACQAGASCPFSHSATTTSDTAPCKYFQKGNCKFGVKCALAHILPDGRRVNPKSLAQAYQAQEQPRYQLQGQGQAQYLSVSAGSSFAQPISISPESPHRSPVATSPFASSIWTQSADTFPSTPNRSSYYRTVSHSAVSRPSFLSSLSNRSVMSEQAQGSAIVDDDEDEVDFVPSSLSDLLTPQELKRRNSRPRSSFADETQFFMDDDILTH